MSKRAQIKELQDRLALAHITIEGKDHTIYALENERRELKAFKKRILQAVEPRRIASAPLTTWSADPAYRMRVDL